MARSDQVKPLKLTAMDAAELRLVAACLQDGLTRLAEMTYLPSKHRFVAVFNRFMWERLDDGKSQPLDGRLYHRVSSGVHFNGVLAARLQGIQQDAKDPFLELLTITCDGADDAEDGARDQTITLVFAGGGHIRLEVECIDCTLSDMGAPWTTRNLPRHETTDDKE
jgi:hypothetical protein